MDPAVTVTQVAPWWGVPLIAGGFLVLGAVLTFFANRLVKRDELRRLDSARWDGEILQSATQVLDKCNEFSLTSNESSDKYIQDTKIRLLVNIGQASELQPILDRLELIASPRLVEASERVRAVALMHAQSDAAYMTASNEDIRKQAYLNLDEAIDNFQQAVRAEIRANR